MGISIIVAMWVIPLGITGIQTGTFFKCEACTRATRTGFIDFITRLTSNVIFTSAAIVISCSIMLQCKKISLGAYSLENIAYLGVLAIAFIIFSMILTTVKENVNSKFVKTFIPILILLLSLSLSLFTVINVLN